MKGLRISNCELRIWDVEFLNSKFEIRNSLLLGSQASIRNPQSAKMLYDSLSLAGADE